jgi:O-antigen ligase
VSSVAATRFRPGRFVGTSVRTASLFGAAAAIAAVLALAMSSTTLPWALVIGGGLGLVIVLGLTLWRYNAALILGFALLGIVKIEPAPTDAVLGIAIVVAAVTGRLVIDRVPWIVTTLLGIYLALNLVSSTAVVVPGRAFRYAGITFYMALFAVWLASWVRTRDRARLVLRAYVFAAVSSAFLGTAAYLHVIPGGGIFLEYNGARAVGLFKDPNVFGAFLVPAALFVLDELIAPKLLRGRTLTKVAMFLLLTVGTLLSFSRAAWAGLAVGAVMMVGILALRRGGSRRAFQLAGVLVVTGVIALAALASSGALSYFQQRTSIQGYDTDRFGAQRLGLKLAQEHPLGIGPGQFEHYSPLSAHSTYVRALAEIGLLGLISISAIILVTLVMAAQNVARGRDTFGIGSAPLLASWFTLLFTSFVIDTLHWRHLWLVAALIWSGAARGREQPAPPPQALRAARAR